MFENVLRGPKDPMFDLKKQADNDNSKNKIDLGVGIYRNEEGSYHELNSVHEVTSVQTISGTGANHLAALFLSRCKTSPSQKVYIGTPTWGNYEPLCALVGLEVVKFPYYDHESASLNFPILLEQVLGASPGSLFILQPCCHNPSGMDLSQPQWKLLAGAMKKADVFPWFDIAYQGLGDSLIEDVYAVRHFAEMGFEMTVCQSFSKNFGLYGERCGALHVICKSDTTAANVYDQLRCLIRWEISSSPLYGSRLVTNIMDDPQLKEIWIAELSTMRDRLRSNRLKLHKALKDNTGSWDVIINTKGLFCCLPLSPRQCQELRDDHHIYLPDNGWINMSGLSSFNIDQVASAIVTVIQDTN
ncbi:unnamed protein product [Penicillium salamii]|uniref:Aminotransferase class I/classII large domain-containing protein n=1 Tax=Penicillium salamii TaxID=1612424 RepID=A0A9W4NGS6_9EURO|nr:unnamed protein product [Penicillium salamii]